MKNIKELLNESSSNRRDILRRKLTEFVKNIYDDGGELIIGEKAVANFMNDGSFVFPKDFNPQLAKFIVQCYIYSHSDWETDEGDYYLYIGDPNKGGKEIPLDE